MKRFWWISRVVLPVVLLVFAFTPALSGVAALILLVVFVGSAMSLFKKIRDRQIEAARRRQHLVRPGLAILIVVLDASLLVSSHHLADRFLINTARRMQRTCQEKGQCPDSIAGFICNNGQCSADAGLTARYRVEYSVPPDRQTFVMAVSFESDTRRSVSGGVKVSLRSSLFLDEKEIKTEL